MTRTNSSVVTFPIVVCSPLSFVTPALLFDWQWFRAAINGYGGCNRKPRERPETWVTDCTGHMGDTFRLLAGGVDTVEGVFGHGQAPAVFAFPPRARSTRCCAAMPGQIPREARKRAACTPLSEGAAPNDLWCVDYKGEFKLGNGRYCYPLTVTDHASRFLLLCEALESTREDLAITAFERLFRDRGLPLSIRSDNGVPFNGLFNLSKLSVWWLRLGITIERIKPGHLQENGRHERMHLTLKKEATCQPGMNALQQQARFDEFIQEFNEERPHEALGMKRPADFYSLSPRPYDGLPPSHTPSTTAMS